MTADKGNGSRFRSRYDTRALPDAVRAVALHCRPEAPQTVSQREFDRARVEVPEHDQAPTARQICTRLEVSWEPLLAALFEPGRDVTRFLGRRQGEAIDRRLTDAHVGAALRTIAAHLGVATLRPAQYDAAREQLQRADRRRYRHGQGFALPSADQLASAAANWEKALAIAGLQPRPDSVGTKSSVVSYHEAIRRFLESQGAMPTHAELAEFARVQGIPLPRTPDGGHKQALEQVQIEFAGAGRWAPATFPPKDQRPAYDFAGVDVRQAGEVRRVRTRSKEECVAGVIAYLNQLDPDDRVSQKHYGGWRAGMAHPAPSAFARHGGWTAILAEARAERRTATRSAS